MVEKLLLPILALVVLHLPVCFKDAIAISCVHWHTHWLYSSSANSSSKATTTTRQRQRRQPSRNSLAQHQRMLATLAKEQHTTVALITPPVQHVTRTLLSYCLSPPVPCAKCQRIQIPLNKNTRVETPAVDANGSRPRNGDDSPRGNCGRWTEWGAGCCCFCRCDCFVTL